MGNVGMECCDLHLEDRSIPAILATEWDEGFWEVAVKALPEGWAAHSELPRFKRLCQDAMLLSHFKYGHVMTSRGKVDFAATILARLRLYVDGGTKGDLEIAPGNLEWLTDVYNFAMIERMHWHQLADLSGTCPIGSAAGRSKRIRSQVEEYASQGMGGAGDPRDLAQVAALAIMEFMHPQHDRAYFKGTDGASPGVGVVEEDDGLPGGGETVMLESNSRWW